MTAGSRASRRLPLILCLLFSTAAIFISVPDLSAQPLTITTPSPMPAGVRGVPYSLTLAATGGVKPYTWSIPFGVLRAGLTLNASSGAISGTPTTAEPVGFTVRVASSGTTEVANKDFTLPIVVPLTITTTSMPSGTVTVNYNGPLNATGGLLPYSWSIASGQLPAGLTLSGSNIVGTPLSEGPSSFTVRVTDNSQPAQTAQASFSIVINPGPITITTTSLPPATVGTAYNQPVTGNGGTTPYHWSIVAGNLPAGLNLVGSAITGTP